MIKSYSPLRIDKIEEVKQMLEKNYDLPTKSILQKIYFIFINRRKYFDREEGEKGLSLKELGLILFSNSVTVDDMLAMNDTALRIIKNTKKYIMKFRKWDGNKEVNLYSLRSKNGEHFYYNIQNEKDLQIVTLRKARINLGYEKSDQRNEQTLSMRPKEREENTQNLYEQIIRDSMKKKKTWDGKPAYQDIDFTGIDIRDWMNNTV
jgi:hypothetical protein